MNRVRPFWVGFWIGWSRFAIGVTCAYFAFSLARGMWLKAALMAATALLAWRCLALWQSIKRDTT